jgi:2-oxoisovalerate dehydrogenase E1 component
MSVQTITRDPPVERASTVDRERGLFLLKEMIRIRRLEEKSAQLYSAMKIRGFLHLYNGEEAVGVGVLQALAPEDNLLSTYREHGQALTRGMSAKSIMAELYGKQEGCSRGRGGSMHLFDKETRFFGGNAIVAGHLPLAVGMALADKMQGINRVTCCFFGDGAVAEGEFHEAMNLCALWELPVLWVCENNRYGMGTALELSESETDIAKKAASYKIESASVDGMNILAVMELAARYADDVRSGKGPRFIEANTYRFRAHSMFDAELYREKSEVDDWKHRDPINVFYNYLQEHDLANDEDVAAIEAEVEAEIDEAVEFAENGTWESPEELTRFVYSEEEPENLYPLMPSPKSTETVSMTYREAMRDGLRQAMQTDERVFLMGEDVGCYGGAFAVSMGLLEEFGPERIRDTPLAESVFTGAGIGASLIGMRPIVEVMTCNFSMLAADQILNNAATLLHMSGGQFNVPVVIRMSTGGGKQLAAQHSHTLEGWYAHIPGIKVITPATVQDARGMILAALEDPDPVLVFENSLLYNMKGEVPKEGGKVDISKAAVMREGTDLTILTYSASLFRTLEAAETLANEGIDAEVIDLRTLRPLDDETIMASVAKTHRVLIVDEGWRSGGISAEIAARIMEQSFYELDQPVERLCGVEVPMPYPKHLEEAAMPLAPDIVNVVRRMING